MDWSKVPDIIAVMLLAWAFASVARRNNTRVSGIWLTGWLLIVIHFTAFLFLPAPGIFGQIAAFVGLATITLAGLLFMWAAVPYRHESSSRDMLWILVATNSLYLCLLEFAPTGRLLDVGAVLLGAGPLLNAFRALRKFSHPLRWTVVALYSALSVFLLVIQHQPAIGLELAVNGVLFTVYFGCCVHFWYMYRRSTAGAFITIYGFFCWAFVFVISPFKEAYFPKVEVESEVWNLPKYVVAIGMILLLLEEQIEHNKHLALHDVLTGLPNRRLFQDRLTNALERARRSGTQAALLVLDLDNFKQVNDTQGHHVGDLLLQRVAAIFSTRIRRSDTVARTGGDEFSVILEGPTSRADALHVGRSLQQLLKNPLDLDNHTVHTGASLGVAIFPDDANEMEALCNAADLRMYENKRNSSIPAEAGTVRHSLPAMGNHQPQAEGRAD